MGLRQNANCEFRRAVAVTGETSFAGFLVSFSCTQKLFENSKFFALKAQADGSLWEQADRIRVLKGRLQDAGTYRLPTRRLTSGYHLSAALRQIGVFKQLLSLGALVTK